MSIQPFDSAFFNTLFDINNGLSMITDSTNINNIYIGYSIPGTAQSASKWAIKQVSMSGNILTTTWAAGTCNFNNIWNNRTSLSYS